MAKVNRIVPLLVILSLVALAIPLLPAHEASANGTKEQLFEHYNTCSSNSGAIVVETHWVAQTFTAEGNHSVISVKLKLQRSGQPGQVTVAITPTDANGHPVCDQDLAQATIDGNSLPTSYQWINVYFPSSCMLTAGTKYAIVVKAPNADYDQFQWVAWHQCDGNPYAGGNKEYLLNPGICGWGSEAYTNDLSFEVYGLPPDEVWVATTGSDSNPGTEAEPFATIQKGIDTVEQGDGGTVHVAAGTYHEHLLISKAVNLIGAGAHNTTINGGGSGRVIGMASIPNTENTISGFTIQNGRYAASLWNPNDEGVLYAGLNLRFLEMLPQPSDIMLGGGGILISEAHIVTLNDCIIKDCISQRGGGITNTGQLYMNRCTVSGNTATTDVGGGIFNYPETKGDSGKMWLTDCTISGNFAAELGGGIRNEGQMWLTNCTISSNQLTHRESSGGGIWNDDVMDLLNCTIAYNSAGSSFSSAGGGFMSIQNDTTYFKNTIVANNTAGNSNFNNGYMEYGLSTSQGHNLSGDDSCGFDRPSDLVKTDPLLGPLQDNGGPTFTHALLHGSPAIDAGTNTGAPATDQRGTPRPQGTRCDIGAYELTQAAVTTATGTGTVSFSTLNGYITRLTAVARPDCPPRTDLDFPHGFFSFTIRGITPGSSATIVIILPSDMPTDTEYWKCINGKWVDCTSLLGSNDGDNILTLTIKDGSRFDRDRSRNGRISDPGGPALATVVAPTVTTPAPPPGPRASPTPPRPLNPTQMSLKYLSVTPQQTTAGQPVTITTNVVNTGDEAGNLNVALKINGQVEETRTVSVGPQGTQPVKFTINKAQPGTYTVDIGGQKGSFTILGNDSTAGRPVNGGMIAILIVGILVLATIVALIATRRRPA